MARHKVFGEGFPPQAEPDPTAHTHEGDFALDLNTATLEELSKVPLLGTERAKAIIAARPFTTWQQIRHLPDFTDDVVNDLRKGGAHVQGNRNLRLVK